MYKLLTRGNNTFCYYHNLHEKIAYCEIENFPRGKSYANF